MEDKPLKIYIGWDSREPIAFEVCKYTLKKHSSIPIEVIPLKHKILRKQGLFRRPWMTGADNGYVTDMIDGKQFSTEFSHTRFLVPILNGYEGWALFIDGDMVFESDVAELLKLADEKYACMVVKHNHKPCDIAKMDDQPQAQYYRKNWSSVVLWNCAHSLNKEHVTLETVNLRPGSWLHQFTWLPDSLIGHLGHEWNWIEGSSPADIRPKIIHYTQGGPWFDNCRNVMYAETWWKHYERWQRQANYVTDVPTMRHD